MVLSVSVLVLRKLLRQLGLVSFQMSPIDFKANKPSLSFFSQLSSSIKHLLSHLALSAQFKSLNIIFLFVFFFLSTKYVHENVPNLSTAQQSSGRRNALFTSKYCHRFCAPEDLSDHNLTANDPKIFFSRKVDGGGFAKNTTLVMNTLKTQ